jgi:hypothetical protein
MHLWRGPVADETCGVPHFGPHLPLACSNFLERLVTIGAKPPGEGCPDSSWLRHANPVRFMRELISEIARFRMHERPPYQRRVRARDRPWLVTY